MVLSFPLPAPPGPSLSDAGTAALATVRALRRNGRGDQRSRAVSPDPRRIGLPRPAVYTSKFNIQGECRAWRDDANAEPSAPCDTLATYGWALLKPIKWTR